MFEESLVIHAAAVTACDLCASRRALAVVEMTVVVGIRSKITIINDCTFVYIRLNARSSCMILYTFVF